MKHDTAAMATIKDEEKIGDDVMTPVEDYKLDDAVPLRYPIPSNDPNDPLNWPWYWKATTYGTICLFSFIANINGSNFTVAIVPLTQAFHIDATHATWLVGFNVLMFGLGNIIWVPLMRVVGKRPVYLMALALVVAANAWSATAATYGSLLGGRMVSGIGASAADATVPSAVAEMFFLEQRGHCMMFFHLALASGIFIGPTINAYLVLHGWRWSCVFLACASGFVLLLAIFLIRETQYYKPRRQYAPEEIPARRSYVGWLSLTIGYNSDRPLKRFLTTFVDIVVMAAYPPVFYVGCLVGIYVGWIIIMQITVAQVLYAKPPYNFSLGGVGLFSLSGLIGALIAFYFGGKLIDFFSNRARRHDHTLKPRPEQRLIALIIPFVLAPIGLIIFGEVISHQKSWVGAAFGYGMHAFGFTAVSNIAVTYAVDSYQSFAGEALVTVFVIRNIIALVCSFYSNNWIASKGLESVFGTMAGIEWAWMLLALVFFFFSAKVLHLTDRYGPMRRLAVR